MTDECAQNDHKRVFQAGREAGYRDALIALAERRGQFFDELDRNIADALRSDLDYVAAHDAAVLRASAAELSPTVRGQVLREAHDEIAKRLSKFPKNGAHVRSSWAVNALAELADDPSALPDGGESDA